MRQISVKQAEPSVSRAYSHRRETLRLQDLWKIIRTERQFIQAQVDTYRGETLCLQDLWEIIRTEVLFVHAHDVIPESMDNDNQTLDVPDQIEVSEDDGTVRKGKNSGDHCQQKKRFTCAVCGKSLSSKQRLQSHERPPALISLCCRAVWACPLNDPRMDSDRRLRNWSSTGKTTSFVDPGGHGIPCSLRRRLWSPEETDVAVGTSQASGGAINDRGLPSDGDQRLVSHSDGNVALMDIRTRKTLLSAVYDQFPSINTGRLVSEIEINALHDPLNSSLDLTHLFELSLSLEWPRVPFRLVIVKELFAEAGPNISTFRAAFGDGDSLRLLRLPRSSEKSGKNGHMKEDAE
ncbi:unnamed protein product [Cyprideis torosa]|uniref:Uncharacterized protein n=1 Tax=Cyprideis torosa TaxID=163714 RepID=A0A7R8WE29_9CRUS|nr:unnamed protein product [Cyprideis torosa]CAG0895369.1 unnamed protein product [Cyprideis torosa]